MVLLLCNSDVNELGKHFPTVDFVFAENKKVSLAPENYLFKVGYSTRIDKKILTIRFLSEQKS